MFGFRKNTINSSDEELMNFVQQGNQKAFTLLYERYSKRLLYYFYRMLGNNNDKAQDFLQDLFMKLLDKADNFDTQRKFSTWIFSIAHNMCKNEYRNMDSRKITCMELPEIMEYDIPLDLDVSQPDTIEATEAFTSELFRELDSFDELHRTAFLMRYREGFSMKDISTILNIPEGTVKSRLFYTRQKLSQSLVKYKPQTF